MRYYVKNKNGSFSRIPRCGHCVNGDKIPAYRSQKQILKNEACEFWEPEEIQITERRESIKAMLRHMKKKLEEIALALQDDQT